MIRRLPLFAALVSTLALGTGCDFIAQLSQKTGIVDVFAASHGTPDEDGNLPSRNGQQLIFTNDMGWEIFINEAYVTTSAVTLQACDGERFDVELYWGPLAEDLAETADRDQAGLGGVRVNSGTYCDLLVEFAPTADEVSNPAAVGTTVYLTGSAVKDDQLIPFLWTSQVEVEATVDISKLENGTPFRISESQHFSKKITISKSYDRFFEGVDFADELSQGDIDALISASLKDGTIAKPGA
jgi:hypothetical protein